MIAYIEMYKIIIWRTGNSIVYVIQEMAGRNWYRWSYLGCKVRTIPKPLNQAACSLSGKGYLRTKTYQCPLLVWYLSRSYYSLLKTINTNKGPLRTVPVTTFHYFLEYLKILNQNSINFTLLKKLFSELYLKIRSSTKL